MLDELTEELLDLTIIERGHASPGTVIAAWPLCCSLALSLCCSSSCSSRDEVV